jgi:ribonuclease P protein component
MAKKKRFGLPRKLRLRRSREFDFVFANSAHAADATLVVHARRNGLPWTRLGVVASRKIGNAPLRNRWKRLMREAFRQQRGQLPAGLDIVVRPRRAATPELTAVRRSLLALLKKLDRSLPPLAPPELPADRGDQQEAKA